MDKASDILKRIQTEQHIYRRTRQPAGDIASTRCIAEIIRPEDIGYTHPIFLQCFLPARHKPSNRERWQTNCGKASLVIRAGELINPKQQHTFRKCSVPAGPKARIINAYISDYALRHRTRTINLGESLREAMRKMDVKISGQNGRELTRELENFAAAEIVLGLWENNGNAHQTRVPIGETLSFWIEKDPNQRTIWQPEMTLSAAYYQELIKDDRMAPIHWPSLIALQHSPMAMDIHCWLVYRLRKGLNRPVAISTHALHAMFGRGFKQQRHFWNKFVEALKAAHACYPTARITLQSDCSGITLANSPPLIPYRKIGRIAGI
jgi:hypothetical protein